MSPGASLASRSVSSSSVAHLRTLASMSCVQALWRVSEPADSLHMASVRSILSCLDRVVTADGRPLILLVFQACLIDF